MQQYIKNNIKNNIESGYKASKSELLNPVNFSKFIITLQSAYK